MKVRDLRAPAPLGPAGELRAPAAGPTLSLPETVRLETRQDASSAARRGAHGPLAVRLAAARARETALSELEATLADPARPARARGEAGVQVALRRVQRDLRPDAAEAALNQALQLAPGLAEAPEARRARVMIRLAQGDAAGAQANLQTLRAAAPEDPELLVLAAEARRQLGDPAGALGLLAEARVHADPARQPEVAARLAFTAAYASFSVSRPQDTLRYAREAFALGVGAARDTRVASKAAQLLRELMCPDFEAPHRAQVALQRRGFAGAGPQTCVALVRQGLGPDQLQSFEEALTRRFQEARAGGVTRPVTDYAGTCVEEYFAESMMAAANPLASPGPCQPRLESRDPKMAALAQAIFADLSRLP